jgi:hypothetical protein
MPFSFMTGSSIVTILSSTVLISASAAYSVVVLPEPVGPVTSTIPRLADIFCGSASALLREAEDVEPQLGELR